MLVFAPDVQDVSTRFYGSGAGSGFVESQILQASHRRVYNTPLVNSFRSRALRLRLVRVGQCLA